MVAVMGLSLQMVVEVSAIRTSGECSIRIHVKVRTRLRTSHLRTC